MRKLIALALSCVMSLTGCSSASMNVQKVGNKALDRSVIIRIKVKLEQEDGTWRTARAGCSGTYVSGDTILSAAHCFDEGQVVNIWVRNWDDNKSYPAEVIKLDAGHDLALLWVHGAHHHKYAKLGHAVKIGQDILCVGSPLGLEFLVSSGIVSQIDLVINGLTSKYIVHDAMINPGSSGGGMFNAKGQLVGVNTMTVGLMGWMGISLTVSVQDVKDFLK